MSHGQKCAEARRATLIKINGELPVHDRHIRLCAKER